MFVGLPLYRDYDQSLWVSRIEDSKKISLFWRNCKTIIFILCEKTFIEKFSDKAENFLGT